MSLLRGLNELGQVTCHVPIESETLNPSEESIKLDLVIDTNVVFDMATRFDLYRAGQERYGYMERVKPGEDPDSIGVRTTLINSDPEVQLRMTRLRCGLALLQFLHSSKKKTYSYMAELGRELEENIPPEHTTMETSEVKLFVNHFKENVFGNWTWNYQKSAPDVKGNAADQLLVDTAKETGAILLSNEGLGRDLRPNKKAGIRRRAATAGVPIFTTIDYLAHVGADVHHLAQAAMMRIWYYFDKSIGRVPWGRLREYNILANWDPNS
jgi:hypothetical protein